MRVFTLSFTGIVPVLVVLSALLFILSASHADTTGDLSKPRNTSAPQPNTGPPLTYTVEYQHIVFSWRPVDGAHHYRLLTSSGVDTAFRPVPGADEIKRNDFRLRIRHWDVDWAYTRYQLQACRPTVHTCQVLGEVKLQPADAARASTSLWHADLQPASEFYLRNSLALSADGDTMAWSGRISTGPIDGEETWLAFPYRTYFSDALFVSRRRGGLWQQEAVFRISKRFNKKVSKAIAISADGTTLAFGSSDHIAREEFAHEGTHSMSGLGAVYIYERRNGQWSKQAVLLPDSPVHSADFGVALALSADGRTVATSDPRQSNISKVDSSHPDYNRQSVYSHGAVFIYAHSKEGWKRQAYLTAPTIAAFDRFGKSLSLSADGRILAVGEPFDDSGHRRPAPLPSDAGSDHQDSGDSVVTNSGSVHIYTRTGQTWSRKASLKGSDPVYEDIFGSSVSLSSNGRVLAVGAPRYSHSFGFYSRIPVDYPYRPTDFRHAGSAYVFARQKEVWTQTEKIRVSTEDVRDAFGAVVSLSADGTTLAVGAPEENNTGLDTNTGRPAQCQNTGAAYVFTLIDNKVIRRRRLAQPNPQPWALYGAFLALSADAATLAVAAPGWTEPQYQLWIHRKLAELKMEAQYQRPDLQWLFVY